MPAGKPKDKNMIKARLVVLAQMFYTKTDEQHSMTSPEILEFLEANDAPANEQTLRGDIRLLQDLGVDIIKIVGRPNRYFWGNRQFEMTELKLLIDAVSSSRFITKKKSRDLVKKLSGLASEFQQKELHRNIQATNRVKSENETIYYTVDTINQAINKRKKIEFRYYEFGPDLKPVFRNDGEVYELSPYALLWNEDYYYVIGWSEKHENVSTFRVDRISDPVILRKRAVKRPKGFRIDDYSKPIFDMFEGQERVAVKLEVRNDLAKYIADRFGTKLKTKAVSEASNLPKAQTFPEDEDKLKTKAVSEVGNLPKAQTFPEDEDKLKTKAVSEGRFIVTVEVSLSPTFYAWVFQFAGGIRILSPKKAVDDIIGMARQFEEQAEEAGDPN